MSLMFRLGARAVTRHLCPRQSAVVTQSRSMAGSPWEGDPPTTTLGGQFKNPVGTGHASQEEISKWVEKELKGGWQSYGYDYYDQQTDKEWNALFMFCTISLPIVLVAIWAYLPDRRMRDWAIREAYLVLRERENAGLEPLSKDFVDPAKILAHLPSDEELEEAGVVINI
eukprot:TRINITY_DN32655_c0_g1_i1.p1 TRINITY_DN32655_c0_g1~~TRINITY_DN32655_c0_g1_i1.p1  ORF type:complete len:170 (-),score=41.14 TRINITY_DN32655_c0_g1_i1:88-597(-)